MKKGEKMKKVRIHFLDFVNLIQCDCVIETNLKSDNRFNFAFGKQKFTFEIVEYKFVDFVFDDLNEFNKFCSLCDFNKIVARIYF